MMSSNDTEYYRRRAIAERALASKSERANVAAIHAELARQYQALADKAELRPTLRIAFPSRLSA
ncbi:hypothetical protein ACMC5O_001700 [Sphingomonas sediminicola]|uniref:hypothetical protein n=1 Tax=Sphingomonas sediminicola TaxID=386874 RepID=UPI003CF78C79